MSGEQRLRMAMLADTARFRPDDPDELVEAAFACPICLHADRVRREAALDSYDPWCECHCPACDERWRVYLAPQQALRLSVLHH